ncbi:MAG: Transcriptional regulator, partial [Dysgonamonadaceae bacterium]|nr:Transcriptional regulator [Dysgonamonadaceae bacterium]
SIRNLFPSQDFVLSRFCYDYGFLSEIPDEVPESISEKCCYIIIKQMDVVEIIKRGKEQNLVMGTDFGLIAYNENPFYEIIGDGIPSFSVDFNLMGSLAADFVLNGEKIQQYLPTRVYRQNSI